MDIARQVIGYARVSTKRQEEEGLSIGCQQDKIETYCQSKGLVLLRTLVEGGVSAKHPIEKRPQGSKLVDAIRSGKVQGVVTLKLDRLFRNAIDCLSRVEEWHQAEVALHLVDFGGESFSTGTAIGKMFITMLAGFAEFERNLISDRTQAALDAKRKRGEKLGGQPPLGKKAIEIGSGKGAVKVLVPCEEEEVMITEVQRLYIPGIISQRKVARILNSKGYRNREGRPLTHVQVGRILRRNEN